MTESECAIEGCDREGYAEIRVADEWVSICERHGMRFAESMETKRYD
jgi:hypothetical protein